MIGVALAVVKLTVSVGVIVALRTVGPEAAGTQEHLATNGATVVVATASQPVITVVPTENATFPAVPVVATIIAGSRPKVVLPPDNTMVGAAAAANADDVPTSAPPVRARAATRTFEVIRFIALLLLVENYLVENYLVLKVPETVNVSAPVSLVPAVVELTGKLPVNFNVPVAPAYFPVPPVIIALPLIATVVGAAEALAHPWEDGSKLAFKVFVPSEIDPAPEIVSHWLDGEDEPVPTS